ncbi:UNVERIFIED_CONTAM: hypothetical protein GTU68_011236 [Idotea baltica]|nr:hypothetical protein [Idotea baltica]
MVDLSSFKRFGQKKSFWGEIQTVKCFEDNTIVKKTLSSDGTGKVLVVDGSGSTGRALMGDIVAGLAVDNSWGGVIIHGSIRDSAEVNELNLGVIALNITPRRPKKENLGEKNQIIEFANTKFRPGDYIYCDQDGVLISTEKLL